MVVWADTAVVALFVAEDFEGAVGEHFVDVHVVRGACACLVYVYNELIAQVYAVRDRVTALTPGYRVVDFLNQTGAMRRIKADRAIELDAGADDLERQRLQIERDRQNVEWTAEAADRVGELMHAAARVARDEAERQTRGETDAPEGAGAANAGEIDVIIIVDPETGGLWSPRTLEGVLVRPQAFLCRALVPWGLLPP